MGKDWKDKPVIYNVHRTLSLARTKNLIFIYFFTFFCMFLNSLKWTCIPSPIRKNIFTKKKIQHSRLGAYSLMEGNRYVEKLVNLEPSACLGRNWFRVRRVWKERVWMSFPGGGAGAGPGFIHGDCVGSCPVDRMQGHPSTECVWAWGGGEAWTSWQGQGFGLESGRRKVQGGARCSFWAAAASFSSVLCPHFPPGMAGAKSKPDASRRTALSFPSAGDT